MRVARWFSRLSIAWKINAIVMFIGGMSMVVACGVFITYDALLSRRTLSRDLAALAELAAINSAAAVARGDVEEATGALKALAVDRDVAAAGIVLPDGRVFARFERDPAALEREPSWISSAPTWPLLSTRPAACLASRDGSRRHGRHAVGGRGHRAAPGAGGRARAHSGRRPVRDVLDRPRAVDAIPAGDLAADPGSDRSRARGDRRAPLRPSRAHVERRRAGGAGRRHQRDDGPDRPARSAIAVAAGGPRRRRRRPHRGVEGRQRGARRGARSGDGSEPRQERIPHQHEPRDPDADERHHRHDGARSGQRSHGGPARPARDRPHSAESLLAVLNDILDFSKIESHRLELESTVFSLADLVVRHAEAVYRCGRSRRASS